MAHLLRRVRRHKLTTLTKWHARTRSVRRTAQIRSVRTGRGLHIRTCTPCEYARNRNALSCTTRFHAAMHSRRSVRRHKLTTLTQWHARARSVRRTAQIRSVRTGRGLHIRTCTPCEYARNCNALSCATLRGPRLPGSEFCGFSVAACPRWGAPPRAAARWGAARRCGAARYGAVRSGTERYGAVRRRRSAY